MERANREGDSVKSKEYIKKLINELQLSREQNELWDGEPQMYINQGWIEALECVIEEHTPKLVVTPDLQVKVE